jgi:glycosyltransferase involved in cell wall biosynthesis
MISIGERVRRKKLPCPVMTKRTIACPGPDYMLSYKLARNPVLSVVTPAYNQAVFLRDTIESVLAQDYPHIEYRVIDDGSTDQTAKVVSEYEGRLLWETQANRGQTPTINKGWSLARGDVLAWLNSDDTFLPGAISTAMRFLEKNPDVGIVFGRSLFTNEQGTSLATTRIVNSFDYTEFVLRCENPIPQPSAFTRREVIEDIGPLNDKHGYFMDWDYWLRAGARHRIVAIPEVLSTYRLHAESKTVSQGLKYAADLEGMYREYFAGEDVPASVRRRERLAMANMYFTSGGYYLRSGDSSAAARMGFRALKVYPETMCSPKLLRKLFYCGLGMNPVYRAGRSLASWARGPRKSAGLSLNRGLG